MVNYFVEVPRIFRIVISDADGTLVTNSKLIDVRAFSRMMTALGTHGIPMCIASGRTYPALRGLFAPFADHLLYFPLDGAFAAAGDTLLCGFPLDRTAIADAMCLLCDDCVRGIELCAQRTTYLYARDAALPVSEQNRLGGELTVLYAPAMPKAEPLPAEPIYKIIVFTRRSGNPISIPTGTRAVYQSDIVTELVRADVNKRRAAELICDALHITPDEILAYGDSENDRELLSWAGTAVTMYGAKHDLFSITKYHTQNVAESVLHFLHCEDAAQKGRGRTHG
ncbi:MAG: HAD family phosphatase [Ruminococcaceae bacterium]|nr:HAD family phosphatase [Oscillospiraceae bacterium]